MRKVITVNLNHNAYQIDEDGYEALRGYLDDAEAALADNPDRGEIMADIEQAIADKCRLALGQFKTVVSAAEIERILTEMGPVVAPEDTSASDDARASGPTGRARVHRVYRIPDDSRWTFTGVCNGLAAYASVDVTWVRAAFVLLTIFTGGFWLVAYGVLVFLLPVARTPGELSAAHGHPFSAQELVDRVKKKHADMRAERRARRAHRAHRHDHHFTAHAPATPQGPPPGPAARVAGGLMLPVFTALSAGWFALMVVAAVIAWHLHAQPFPQWPPATPPLSYLPAWIPLVAVLAIYALLALPISAGRRAALYYANGGTRHGWADAWAGLLWLALVAVLLVAAWRWLPQLQVWVRDMLGPSPRVPSFAWQAYT